MSAKTKKPGVVLISTIEEGVTATVRLAIDDDVADVSGELFDGLRRAKPNAQAGDATARQKLLALSEELTA